MKGVGGRVTGFDKAGVQSGDRGREEKNNGERKVEESEEGE